MEEDIVGGGAGGVVQGVGFWPKHLGCGKVGRVSRVGGVVVEEVRVW